MQILKASREGGGGGTGLKRYRVVLVLWGDDEYVVWYQNVYDHNDRWCGRYFPFWNRGREEALEEAINSWWEVAYKRRLIPTCDLLAYLDDKVKAIKASLETISGKAGA